VLEQGGDEFPILEQIVSLLEDGFLKKPMKGMFRAAGDDLVVTFGGLVERTDFIPQMKAMLSILQDALGMPVDLEFAHDGERLYLLQCRPQSRMGDEGQVTIPSKVPFDRKMFSASKYVTNGHVEGIRYIVYVDPEEYRTIPDLADLHGIAEAVSHLNQVLPRRKFILMGPGRWGSRGDVTLGVGITYSGINNTSLLVEIARKKGNYVPDLSFGTHFFQDLVEARIHYLALYPDDEGNLFNEAFFRDSPSVLLQLLPEHGRLERAVRVIDVEQIFPGCEFNVVMDADKDRALGFVVEHPHP
jgi:pyruvate, water dikinase